MYVKSLLVLQSYHHHHRHHRDTTICPNLILAESGKWQNCVEFHYLSESLSARISICPNLLMCPLCVRISICPNLYLP